MRKLLIITILLSLSLICCAHNPVQNTPQNSIEGVWACHPDSPLAVEGETMFYRDLSWGRRYFHRNISMIIDLHSTPPTFEIPELTWDEIISVKEEGNKTELTFYFARGGFNVTVIFHFNEDGTMWIESYEGGFYPGGTGRDFPYYKIDGP